MEGPWRPMLASCGACRVACLPFACFPDPTSQVATFFPSPDCTEAIRRGGECLSARAQSARKQLHLTDLFGANALDEQTMALFQLYSRRRRKFAGWGGGECLCAHLLPVASPYLPSLPQPAAGAGSGGGHRLGEPQGPRHEDERRLLEASRAAPSPAEPQAPNRPNPPPTSLSSELPCAALEVPLDADHQHGRDRQGDRQARRRCFT